MCGFTDVRCDEEGYYCQICGNRMPSNYEDVIRGTLPPKRLQQLREQCEGMMPRVEKQRPADLATERATQA